MAAVRYLVLNIEESLPFYEALGFTVVGRPGSPIVMVKRDDLTLWLSGPGSSAARTLTRPGIPSSCSRLAPQRAIDRAWNLTD